MTADAIPPHSHGGTCGGIWSSRLQMRSIILSFSVRTSVFPGILRLKQRSEWCAWIDEVFGKHMGSTCLITDVLWKLKDNTAVTVTPLIVTQCKRPSWLQFEGCQQMRSEKCQYHVWSRLLPAWFYCKESFPIRICGTRRRMQRELHVHVYMVFQSAIFIAHNRGKENSVSTMRCSKSP